MFMLYTLAGGGAIFALFLSVLYDNPVLIIASGAALVLTFLGAFANFYNDDNDGGNAA
jgi:hypothetical protein